MNMNNHVKSINFMAIGYRIAFLRFHARLKKALMITKFSWKIVNYLMMPLGLKGIVDKIKKAFYESDSTKIVI